jgi:predicted DNA-binding transcriptional regulator AlpA
LEGLGIAKRNLVEKIITENWKVVPDSKTFSYKELLYVIQEMLDQEGTKYLQDQNVHGGKYAIYRRFVELMLYRNMANYDSMVLITSAKGGGKSSAAIMMAKEWCRLIGIQFNPEQHIAYNNADVMNKIDSLPKFSPIILDEAVRFVSSEDWAKKGTKELKKRLAQVRTKHLLFILCFPLKIYKLEKNFLEAFVNYWCLTGDTKIFIEDENGMKRNFPIKELQYKKNYKIATYNLEKKEIEYKIPEKCIRTHKEAEVYEIELINGQKISATKEHQFLTKRGYVKLEDLTNDDEIVVKTKICLTCKKEFISKREQMKYCSVYCKKHFNEYIVKNYQRTKRWRKENIEKNKIMKHENYLNNREERLKKAREYRIKNRKNINNYAEKYRGNNIELLRQRDKNYRIKNREQYLGLSRKKYYKYMKENPNFKIRTYLGHRLYAVLDRKNNVKKSSIMKYLGCSIEELKKYLENKFRDGMSWGNYSKTGWHVDHIRPCASFDLTKEEEIYKCFHYTNLQPLWAKENMIKSDNYDINKN